jgi:hypothetical protein
VLQIRFDHLQVIGPRHSFAVSKGLEAKLQSPGGTCSSSVVRNKGGAWGWNLSLLVAGEDVDFAGAWLSLTTPACCAGVRLSGCCSRLVACMMCMYCHRRRSKPNLLGGAALASCWHVTCCSLRFHSAACLFVLAPRSNPDLEIRLYQPLHFCTCLG